MAVLATFAACLGGALRVILEVAAANLATFLTRFRCALRIFSKVATTTAMFCHCEYSSVHSKRNLPNGSWAIKDVFDAS